jgi:hypothetical protein
MFSKKNFTAVKFFFEKILDKKGFKGFKKNSLKMGGGKWGNVVHF